MYLIRLDDASEYWDKARWEQMSALLDVYNIKPIFGIIPENQDPQLRKYALDTSFWETVSAWIKKGYTPALHSDTHVYCSDCAGINPVNKRSEFAGVPLEKQCEKIRRGNAVLQKHGVHAEIFFALAHTFDLNTLKALEQETDIRIISDTIATDIYHSHGFYFIPQQAGGARELPFQTVTFCYHPNTMSDKAFAELETFLNNHRDEFTSYPELTLRKRRFGVRDWLLKQLYFAARKLRKPAPCAAKHVNVLQIFGSLGMGGAESRMMDVYRNMDRQVFQVDFLTMQDGPQHYEPELAAMGAKVIHARNPRKINIFQHIAELRRIMKNGRYQAVHAHTSYHCGIALFAAWLAGVPVRIAHARTTGSKQRSLQSRLSSGIGKCLIRFFSTTRLAISQNAGAYVFGRMPFCVIPNAICVSSYMNTPAGQLPALKREWGIPGNAFVIGHIGRFDEMKNHRFTLTWFSEYRKTHHDAHLILVGDGALRSEMEALADTLGVKQHTTFTGIREDVPRLIHAFDVLIFPSLFEGLGGVVLEAQAAGIPVVESTNIPDEADLGLRMVRTCRLEDDFSVWSTAVDDCRGRLAPDEQEIKTAFTRKGYSIDAVTKTYCQLYEGKHA